MWIRGIGWGWRLELTRCRYDGFSSLKAWAMQRLDFTDNERAALITALRQFVEREPDCLSVETLRAILNRLEPQKPQRLPADASTG